MNADHRRIITTNIDKLIERTDIGALLPKLLEKGVFLESMLLKYQSGKVGMERDLKRDLYFEIQTRGPAAFKNLISALNESGHYTLTLLLESEAQPVSNLTNRPRVHPFTLPEYLTNDPNAFLKNLNELTERHPKAQVNLGTEPITIRVKKATNPMDSLSKYKTQVYPMGSRPKGYAMIINIKKYNNDIKKERFGAEHDEKNLKILLEELGYNVITHENLSADDMMEKLKHFTKDKGHSHVDSCILAILSHGEQDRGESCFVAADGKAIPVTSVLELFSNEHCAALRKKPKIFLFQSCRGDRKVHGIRGEFNRTGTDGIAGIPLRSFSDMLIAYSTVNGYQSHRDLYLGTWFIQAVCEVFMQHACDTEIMELLKLVDTRLENLVSEDDTMQTTCFENRGFKTFFFNPGIYDNDKVGM